MHKKDKTFELLNSLSEAEKRFAKKYQTSKKTVENYNQCIRLFEAMGKQEAYNEDQLKAMLQGEININNIVETKNKLYDLILESMDCYNKQNSMTTRLYDNLKRIEFLVSKNLNDQAAAILDKTLQLAKEQDFLELMPEMMRWKKKLLIINNYETENDELKQLCFDEVDQIDQLELINKFWKLQATLAVFNKPSNNRVPLKIMESVFSERIMQLSNKQLPFRARFLKNKIYSTYFYIIKDWQSCFNYLKEMINLLEHANYQTEFYQNEYIETLQSLVEVTTDLSLATEFKCYAKQLENLYASKLNYRASYLKAKIEKAYCQLQKKKLEAEHKEQVLLETVNI